MEEFCLDNYFVFELCFAGGCPLKEASELDFLYNKGIIYGIYCVIVLYILLILLILVITIMFLLYIVLMIASS
jgi:hypothetical protein